MKPKNIERLLRREFDKWVASIEDGYVADLVSENSIISGGSIASLLMNDKYNDLDIYFRDKKTTLAVAKYYANKFAEQTQIKSNTGSDVFLDVIERDERIMIVVKSAGVASDANQGVYQYFESRPDDETIDYIEKVFSWREATMEALDKDADEYVEKRIPYRPVFVTTNAITLSDKVQIIIRFYGSAREIHDNFDFVHCTNYWKSWDGQLVLRKDALEKILTKTLQYVGSRYPICSLFRLRKFLTRGWTITAGQILKIALQISDLDLRDINTLEDQLIGVDVAYFREVIERVKDKTDGEKVDRAYLVQIIDELF